MGRRQLEDKEKRKVQVNIRLTDDEYNKITTFATGCDLTPANWMRKKVFTGKFPATKISPIDSAAIQELRRIGVNLNQAVHKINEGHLPEFFLSTLLELKRKMNELINHILDDGKSD